MAGIADILKLVAALEGEEGTELQTSIETEFNTVSEAANARVEELLAQNDDLVRELGEVKARNYDLMVAATAQTEPEEPEETIEEVNIDDLFKEV